MGEQDGNDTAEQSAFSFALAGIHLTISGSETLIREVLQLLRSDILPNVGPEGIRSAAAEPAPAATGGKTGTAAGAAATPEGSTPTPQEYFAEKQPRAEHEKAAVFAHYLKLYRNTTEFTVEDIEELYNEAHVPIKNVQNAIYNAGKKGKGWIKGVEGKQSVYYLTAAGESYVKTQLPKSKK